MRSKTGLPGRNRYPGHIDCLSPNVMPEPNSGCWLWLGSANREGYGRVQWRTDGRKFTQTAHRASYEGARGPIPDGLLIDHLCRNPACINPDHLEPVTAGENVRRGNSGSNTRAKTHCPKGHPYVGNNIKWKMVRGAKARVCRSCSNEGDRQYRARKGHSQ